MKLLRAAGYIQSADILSLFIAFTLAVSGKLTVKLLSTACTVGILFCFMAALAVKTAKEDIKQERISGKGQTFRDKALMWSYVSIVPVGSWIVLCISRFGFQGYYLVHKLLNAYFIQVYNMLEPGLSSELLTAGQLAVMGALSLVPGTLFMASYFTVRRKLGH